MTWPYLAYPLVLLATAGLTLAVAVFAWLRRTVLGAGYLTLLMLAVAEWAAAAALESLAVDVSTKVLFSKVEYLGGAFVTTFFMLLALQYSGQDRWVTRRHLWLVFLVPAVTVLMVGTNDWHHLHWADFTPSPREGITILLYGRGPWFWVALTHYSATTVIGSIALGLAVFRFPRFYQRQALALLTAGMAPFALGMAYIFGWGPVPGLDTTPLGAALTSLITAWAVLRYQLLDLVPVARDALIESMADGVLVLDEHNRIVDANPAAQHLFAPVGAPLVGRPAEDVLPNWIEIAYPSSAAAAGQAAVLPGDGVLRYVDIRVSALRVSGQRSGGRLVVVRDISDVKRAEESLSLANERLQAQLSDITILQANLREQERRLRLIAENTSDVVFAFDMERSRLYVNPAIEKLTGFGVDEVPENALPYRVHPDDETRIKDRWERLFTEARQSVEEFRIIARDGQTKWILSAWGPLRDETGRQIGVQGHERDITERKRAQEKHTQLALTRHTARAVAEADERLRQEIAEFLHGRVQTRLLVAWHRLKEARPLVAVDPQRALQLMEEVSNQIDGVREEEIRRASHMLHPSIISLGLVPAVQSLVADSPRSVEVVVDVDQRLTELDALFGNQIPERLRLIAYRVVEEALNNAYRHARAKRIEVSLGVDDRGWLTIAVEDDGCGFDPAQTTSGLGLRSIAGRVDQVDGTWQIETASGRGTRLSAAIPLSEAAPPETLPTTDPAVVLSRR